MYDFLAFWAVRNDSEAMQELVEKNKGFIRKNPYKRKNPSETVENEPADSLTEERLQHLKKNGPSKIILKKSNPPKDFTP
jgi:hypothetical protein